ncbi:hypothetical protein DID80_05930 [Candidatus Marinamargulisbacteria bacterium SCGC AAA071-K20]|nr:hypothetical protein DID80_05930 [Candidatus Marinamargulisbacteria bacterium SCGC AAA071-K20]
MFGMVSYFCLEKKLDMLYLNTMNFNSNKLDKATVTITGGCGFIGSFLVKFLVSTAVKKIIVIDHLKYGSKNRLPDDKRIEVHKLDLAEVNEVALEKVMKGTHFLFHLAAEKHNQSFDTPADVFEANIAGFYRLMNAAKSIGVKKVVFSSSLYVYGATTKDQFSESDIPRPHTLYGLSKHFGEELLHYNFKQFGIDYVAIRYFFVYGPEQYNGTGYKSVIVKNFERLCNGLAPIIKGDGKQSLDYIYIDDIATFTIKAMTSTATDITLNFGSEKAYTINELTKKMIAIAGSNLDPVYEEKDITHNTKRVCSAVLAKEQLGFEETVGIDEGLKRTYNWVKHNK